MSYESSWLLSPTPPPWPPPIVRTHIGTYLLSYPKSSDALPPSVLPADSQHHTASDTSVLPSLSPSSLALSLSGSSSGALMLNNSAAQSRAGRREENVDTERDVNAKADG